MKQTAFVCEGQICGRDSLAWTLNRWRRGRKYGIEEPRPEYKPFSPVPASEMARKALRLMAEGWTGGEVVKLSICGRGLKITFVDGVPAEVWDARNGEPWTLFNCKLDPEGRELFGNAARYSFSHNGATACRKAVRAMLEAFFASDSPAAGLALLSQGTNCVCCGADLTDPESIKRGIGPECFRKRGGVRILFGLLS